MMKFLEHRISDPNLLRLIARFLKNGYMEENTLFATDKGTPQGGIVSPILANIYLHYVLDLWFEYRMKPQCKGVAEIVRYADDFVICVQFKEDADKIHEQLRARIEEFNLELAEDKTRVIGVWTVFGAKMRKAEVKGQRPSTFWGLPTMLEVAKG